MESIEFIGKCLLIDEKGRKILVVGDLHLGYEGVLNIGGIFVGGKTYEEMIKYFDKIFEFIKNKELSDVRGVRSKGKIKKKRDEKEDLRKVVDEVVLLGDVKHVFGDITNQEWNDVLALFDYFDKYCKKIVIVKGNHDVILKPIVKRRNNIKLVDCYMKGSYAFMHGDRDFKEVYDKKVKVWIMGHGHPAIKIREGVKTEKYKCFLVGNYEGREVIIVPSFLEANIGSDPRENNLYFAWNFDLENFEVKIVSEDLEVLDFGKLGKLK